MSAVTFMTDTFDVSGLTRISGKFEEFENNLNLHVGRVSDGPHGVFVSSQERVEIHVSL